MVELIKMLELHNQIEKNSADFQVETGTVHFETRLSKFQIAAIHF